LTLRERATRRAREASDILVEERVSSRWLHADVDFDFA
jgi:hypothetical protein